MTKKLTQKQNELKGLLAELRAMLFEKVNQSEQDIETLSTDNFAKLVSLTCRAVTDIAKAEKELETKTSENYNWSKLAQAIRNDPKSLKLAKELSKKVYGNNSIT